MYTVDRRARLSWSSASSGWMARPGAAMWMPSTTVPVPRPCSDSASSISVVCESSMENACTLATGSSSVMAGAARPGANAVPLGKFSNKKRCQWNW